MHYVKNLAPYWPLCQRLSSMTRDLLITHSQMYQSQRRPSSTMEESTASNNSLLKPPPPPPTVPFISPNNNDNASRSFIASPCGTISTIDPTATTATTTTPTAGAIPSSAGGYLPSFNASSTTPQLQAPQQPSSMPIKEGDLNNLLIPGVINFDSLDFLYDTELYGQLMFDDRPSSAASSPALHNNNIPTYSTMAPQGSSASTFNAASSSSSSQRPTIQQRRGATMLYGLQAARQPPIMQ